MSEKTIHRHGYFYSCSTTEEIQAEDYYIAVLGGDNPNAGKPIKRKSNDPPGWGKRMLEDGIYLKIKRTDDPNVK